MMIKSRVSPLSLLIFIAAILAISCNKENSGDNKLNEYPSCYISLPASGQEFEVGDIISISVNAADQDGVITDVQFYVNGILKNSVTETPYIYQWNTSGEVEGQYLIKVTSVDNENAVSTDEIAIELKKETSNFETYTDPRDGKTYVTVKIGEQTWFTENLSFGEDSTKYSNSKGYYSWKSAISACPDGWHLPTDEEWKEFEMNMHMTQNDADAIGWRGEAQGMWLKSKEGWKNEGNGTDKYGFNAKPEGYLSEEGERYHYEEDALFWTATFHGSEESAWYRRLNYGATAIGRLSTTSTARFNVRCVKN